MIVDCFTFADEFDMLELRLRTLEGIVDRFVLCEAPFTFRGDPKPLHFRAQSERFARWRDRIVPLLYPGAPSDNPWLNEWGQRDFLATALAGCAPGDLVLIGDCDELPDPQLVARRPAAGRALVHRMLLARGFVNRLDSLAYEWPGTRAVALADLARFGGPSDLRKAPLAELESVDGGWHFSSLGDTDALARKMRAYSHAEYDVAYYRDRARLELERTSEGTWVPLDDRFPAPLREDRRWAAFVAAEPAPVDTALARKLAHAHGCLAYVPHGAHAVAVLTHEPGVWREAAAARPQIGELRVATGAESLAADGDANATTWAVIDGIERYPRGTLATLANAGLPAVVFAANARSFEVFQRVVSGHAGFPPGRAVGASELDAEIAAAGYRVATRDRIFSLTLSIPHAIPPGYEIALGSFSFSQVEPETFFDFLARAFVVALAPASPHAAQSSAENVNSSAVGEPHV